MPARRNRVTRGDDYRRIVRGGIRVGGRYCVTYSVPHSTEAGSQPARFGFIVSKAVGNAVTRNLARRRLKSIAQRRLDEGFAGRDIVFRALPAIADAPFAEIEHDVTRALRRAGRPATGQGRSSRRSES